MLGHHQYFVYILATKYNTVLYVGVTNDVQRRVWEHKQGAHAGFAKKYGCTKLVYYENHQYINDAIAREKQLKAGSRQAKIDLIIANNSDWKDLSEGWYDNYLA